jgi:integrase
MAKRLSIEAPRFSEGRLHVDLAVGLFRGTSLHGFVAVASLTGMRRNEILALRWVDVNLAAATVTVTREEAR